MRDGPGAGTSFRGSLSVDGEPLGDLPYVEEPAGCRVLLRGFVSNRRELATELQPRAGGDAELIALAYRRWGSRLAAHVQGEYAAAVADPRARTAALVHDPLGIVPLFYARLDGRVEFASHLADLVAVLGPGAIDRDYLADYLAVGEPSSERTPYTAIRRLVPGESLSWSPDGVTRHRVWRIADAEPVRLAGDGEYETRLRELLAEAVNVAADPAGPTWCELSGGLDSSSVTSVAAREGIAGLAALSVVHGGAGDQDERGWMRSVVEEHALPWHILEWDDALPFSQLPDDFVGEPTGLAFDTALMRSRDDLLREHGVGVVMTGQGGDEVMASQQDQPIIADLLFERRPLQAARELVNWRRGDARKRSHLYWAVRHVATPALDHLRGRGVRPVGRLPSPPWFDPEWERTADLEARRGRRRAPRSGTPGRAALAEALWSCSVNASVMGQRRSGPALRYPLLHLPLVEYMAAIPWEQKIRPGCDRHLQRRALRGILPEKVRRRRSKSGTSAAIIEGLRRGREWFELLTDDPHLARLGIVEADRWREAVRQARLGQTHGDIFFLAAVNVEAWAWQLERATRPAT